MKRENTSNSEQSGSSGPAAEKARLPTMLAPDLTPSEVVSASYKVLRLVGRGAVGNVYAVEHIRMKKPYALKMLNSSGVSSRSRKRFENESLAASKLDHPNLVRAVDYGIHDNGCLFMVMDFVEGKTLSEYLKQMGRLSIEQTLDIFIPICFALEYAHEQGIIHRDLKPSNLILEDSGSGFVPKIVDFGIAKLTEDVDAEALTRTGEVFGTPLYMSPEQCTGSKVDQRSDIYSLGCVMYEALTGTPPFCGMSALETMMQHRIEPFPSMSEASLGTKFPEALEKIIARMLAKDPADRYQRCFTLADHLMHFQRGETVGDLPRLTAPVEPTPVLKKRKPRFAAVYSLVVLFLLLLTVAMVLTRQKRRTAPDAVAHVTPPTVPNSPENSTPAAQPGGADTEFRSNGDLAKELTMPHFDPGPKTGTRVFHFGKGPKDLTFTFGSSVRYSTPQPNGQLASVSHSAVGDLSVPASSDLEFDPSVLLTMYRPYLFRSFRPDEFDVLKLNFSDLVEDKDIDAGCFNASMSYVSSLTGLHRLYFMGVPLDSNGLANLRIENMHDLELLDLQRTGIDGKTLARLPIFGPIRCVEYSDGKNVSVLIKSIFAQWSAYDATRSGPLPTRDLVLRRDGLTDDDLANLTYPHLTDLDIKDNSNLTEAGLKHLEKLKELKSLIVHGQHFSPLFLHDLALKLNLKCLDCGRVSWTEAQKEQLKNGLNHCHINTVDAKAPLEL